MMRPLLSLLAGLLFLSGGAQIWAEDPAPAPAATPAAAPAAAAPAPAAPAPAAAAAPAPAADAAAASTPAADAEKKIRASKEWFGYTYKPYTDDDKKAWADAEAKLKTNKDDADAKKVMDDKATADAVPYKTKDEKEIAPAASSGVNGDNAWMLVSSALVLLMTAPGLALFYGGLVRRKNVLGTMMQSFAMVAIVTLVWTIFGFSLAFGDGNSYFGNFSQYLFLKGVVWDDTLFANSQRFPVSTDYAPTISFGSYAMFQLMFAIITPALICGAYAERMKFAGMALFNTLWLVVVYCPMAHMVWGKNGLFNWGFGAMDTAAFDFAGGTVVHISSGVAALVCAIMLGKRKGYPNSADAPALAGDQLHRRVPAVGRLVRLQRGLGARCGRPGHPGLRQHPDRDRLRGDLVAPDGVDPARQADRARRHLRRGGRPRRHHPGLRLRHPRQRDHHRPGRRRAVLHHRQLHEEGAGLRRFAGRLRRALHRRNLGRHRHRPVPELRVEPLHRGPQRSDLYRKIMVDHAQPVVLNQIKAVLLTIGLSAVGSVVIFTIVKFTIGVRVKAEDEETGLDLSQHGEEGYVGVG